jgi:hypothetical protein
MIKDDLRLPKEALVNKFVAKSRFYEKAKLSSRLQKEFVDKIQRITWKYKLAESTIGIAKTEAVTEIQIFEIELKEQKIPKNVLRIIDTSIPYQILYRFVHEENVAYGISLKDGDSVGSYYFSDWNADLVFDFTGIDLELVYQKLVKAFLRDEAKDKDDFSDIVSTDQKIRTLETEIVSLESRIQKERQFNRKVEIHRTWLKKKTLLADITGGSE